jgi:CheY-like chemotaxis protein
VIELNEVLSRVIEMVAPLIEERRHDLAVGPAAAVLLVDVDPARMAQVFGNLLTNAAKYTDPGGRIEVATRAEGGDVVVDITDNGIGFDPALLQRMFDLFTQEPQSSERSRGGLGLGLAIARNLVELHGGSIHASSAGRGQGSLFVVQLPSPASLVPDDAGAPPTSTTSASARVLVVDDNVDAADALAEMLALEGHEVRTASSGASALECLEGFHADVALLDIGLPDISGHELAASIRRDPRWRSMRLIALTGYGRGPDVERALAAGFDAHLTKPADIELILHTIAQTG